VCQVCVLRVGRMRYRMSDLYPFLLQPLFDLRPSGTMDLAPD